MNRLCVSVALMGSALLGSSALAAEPDSIKINELNEVIVKAVKAPQNAPFAVSRIGLQELQQFSRTGQELPFLFSRTPGVISWSENGLGTGTTYMRIRGAADSRINVTLDGVSLNSPEDQCVFWANTNSYASLLDNVQIQRGVGTSTNGDGAFGGTIALTTKSSSYLPTLDVNASYGSYNTYNVGANFSTGMTGIRIPRGFLSLDGAYHHTGTDGYMHGTSGNSGSYFAGITWINPDGNIKVSYKNIGNYEKTGQAWNGVDSGELLDWNYGGMGTGLFDYHDLYKAGLGRFNTLYEYLNDSYDPSAGTSRYQMADGSLWPRTTDNFWQNHNLLSLAYQVNSHWSTSGTIHYTHGHGYYEEFRSSNKLSKFGLSDYPLSDGSLLKRTDFVRQKGLSQDTYGMVWNANYQDRRWDIIGGASFQNFQATHYGYLTYVANPELRQAILAQGRYQYYDSSADKSDISSFLKATCHITPAWDIFGDIQYRHVGFSTSGINDKFYALDDGTYANQQLDISRKYNFANPKAGISFHHSGHNAYASYALSHREPERNNFTDNGAYPAPRAEILNDMELGYSFTRPLWNAGANLYAMLYHNQFVQTGQVSDIGESLTTNIRRSYRLGIELTAGLTLTPWLSLQANAALSQNRIQDFDEYIEDWDWTNGQQYTVRHYDHSTLAFSPSAIVNGFADFHLHGFQATWHTGFVSRQYLDNTATTQRSLPSYSRTDLTLGYTLPCGQRGLKQTIFGLHLNNLFNAHQATSGWVYSALYASGGNPEGNRFTQIGYIPLSGFTLLGTLTLKF
ncbi:MAG: TonB-dependent receptor plug domain-containing protein [Bacteroidaceae bacterium]|nr:TonB-dependent receptor plug domain-containing protein [Bacteroidaceae bacterium]